MVSAVLFLSVAFVTALGCEVSVPTCFEEIDLTFIVDQSESIRENDPPGKEGYNWNIFKDFIKKAVDSVSVGSKGQVALIKFSSQPELMWNLQAHSEARTIYSAVDSLVQRGGNTDTAAALKMARQSVYRRQSGDRRDAEDIVILMTDGLSTIDTRRVKPEADKLWDAGIQIYIVAVGKYVDQKELRSMVPDFSRYIIHVDDFSQLEFVQTLLLHRICRLPDPFPDCDPITCDNIMDLALIVDNSGSVADAYDDMRHFLANLADQFDISPNQNQIAMVTYSDDARLQFGLGDITNKERMKQKILNLPYPKGSTNTSGAIRFTRRHIFSRSRGDRPRVRNVIILITDGRATKEQAHTIHEAQQAKALNIKFFAVGVTTSVNADELKQMTSLPVHEHYFDSTAVKYLNALIYPIVMKLCSLL